MKGSGGAAIVRRQHWHHTCRLFFFPCALRELGESRRDGGERGVVAAARPQRADYSEYCSFWTTIEREREQVFKLEDSALLVCRPDQRSAVQKKKIESARETRERMEEKERKKGGAQNYICVIRGRV